MSLLPPLIRKPTPYLICVSHSLWRDLEMSYYFPRIPSGSFVFKIPSSPSISILQALGLGKVPSFPLYIACGTWKNSKLSPYLWAVKPKKIPSSHIYIIWFIHVTKASSRWKVEREKRCIKRISIIDHWWHLSVQKKIREKEWRNYNWHCKVNRLMNKNVIK